MATRKRFTRDYGAILLRLSDARDVPECAVNSLEVEPHRSGPEAVCLRHGLDMLRGVYDELDRAA